MHILDMKTEKDTEQVKNEILLSPTASYWIKESIIKLSDRDLVDAANDAEMLNAYFQKRCKIILGI